MAVRPANTQISLGIRPVWSESSLSAWKNLGPLTTHSAHSEDSGKTGRTLSLLVLSCRGSIMHKENNILYVLLEWSIIDSVRGNAVTSAP